MTAQTLTHYFYQYGGLALFVVVLLEYLNLPGFPAGIIMPMAGIWAAKGGIGLGTALFLSVLAGLLGSWILYFVGRFGGEIVISKYIQRFPKHKPIIDNTIERIRTKGGWGVFVGKLLPMVRTIISIPAGVLKMDFLSYTLFSTFGIIIWNTVFVGAGYVFGDAVFKILKITVN